MSDAPRFLRPQLPAFENENALASWSANHSRGTAIGGELWLTDRRLVFVPNTFEQKLSRGMWECVLVGVQGVSVAPRGLNPFSGALRRRLAIQTDNATELFVVSHAGEAASRISAAVTAAQRS